MDNPQSEARNGARVRRFLTDAQVRALPRGRWLQESLGKRGLGRLAVRGSAEGRPSFFFRYAPPKGERKTIALGVYDARGAAGLTLQQARERARELAAKHHDADQAGRDVADVLADERQAAAAKAAADRIEVERVQRELARSSLRALLAAYVAHLEARGKPAAGDARRMFRRHVLDAWPELADTAAALIRPADVTVILRRVVQQGAGRTAAKLRSFMRAAYALALRAENDAAAPAELLSFRVETNPAAMTAALSEFNRTRDRALSEGELAFYAAAIEAAPASPAREGLRLALLLGGQRMAQLLRAKRSDVDLAARSLTLLDAKGKRTEPRRHVLPLTKPAAAIVAGLLEVEPPKDAPGWLFTTNGKAPTRVETCEELAHGIFAAMQADALLIRTKAAKGPAQLRDIRRTCETHLAALGVSRDVRAQVQSHGLGGVQDRHYDRHSYEAEKRAALDAWGAYLKRIKAARAAAIKRGEDQAPAAKAARAARRVKGGDKAG